MGNTFSLIDLCGCGDPCPDCCVECCQGAFAPIASTIYGTISDSGCGNGTVVTCVYNSGTAKWEGTNTLGACGRSITLKFYCIGINPTDFRLDVSFSDSCISPMLAMTPDAGAKCNGLFTPFNAKFSYTDTGACAAAGLVTIDFTE